MLLAVAAVWCALLLGLALGALLARSAAERRARAAWRADTLAALTDASAPELKRLLGQLPPWVRDAEFQKTAWVNTAVRQLWPFIDKAAGDIVHAKLRDVFSTLSLAKFGVSSVTLTHFSLGPPPKLAGVKAWDEHDRHGADAIVLDLDLRVAGAQPNAIVTVRLLTGTELVLQLGSLTLSTVARVTLAPLAPALPCASAASVSLLGYPFLDFSLTALKGDIMAIPGLEAAVSAAVKSAVKAYVWPQRLVVPIVPDADGYPALQPRARGALLLRVTGARRLPVTDLAPGASIDPYVRVRVGGHPTVAETAHARNTRQPSYDLTAVLPVVDPAAEAVQLELWDANALASDQLVATAELFIGEALRRSAATPGAFSGWVPLQRCETGALDVSAGLSAASGRLRGMVGAAKKEKQQPDGATAAPPPDGGEVHLEFAFVPFAALRPEAHDDDDDDDVSSFIAAAPAGQSASAAVVPRLPAGWSLPAAPRVLSVRLLRAVELVPPPGWPGRAEPFVTLRLGGATRTSATGHGTSPAFHQLFEFTHVDVGATPRLHLTVAAGPLKASAAEAVGGALAGAAKLATLGALKLDGGGARGGAAGGLLGRVPACAADAEVPASFEPNFLGRAVVDLEDVRRRCALAGGPVADTLPLLDAPGGALVVVLELRRLAALPSEDELVAATVSAAAEARQAGAAALPAATPAPAEAPAESRRQLVAAQQRVDTPRAAPPASRGRSLLSFGGAKRAARLSGTQHVPQQTARGADVAAEQRHAKTFSCFG